MAESQVCTWLVRYLVLHGQRIRQCSHVPALWVDPQLHKPFPWMSEEVINTLQYERSSYSLNIPRWIQIEHRQRQAR